MCSRAAREPVSPYETPLYSALSEFPSFTDLPTSISCASSLSNRFATFATRHFAQGELNLIPLWRWSKKMFEDRPNVDCDRSTEILDVLFIVSITSRIAVLVDFSLVNACCSISASLSFTLVLSRDWLRLCWTVCRMDFIRVIDLLDSSLSSYLFGLSIRILLARHSSTASDDRVILISSKHLSPCRSPSLLQWSS